MINKNLEYDIKNTLEGWNTPVGHIKTKHTILSILKFLPTNRLTKF